MSIFSFWISSKGTGIASTVQLVDVQRTVQCRLGQFVPREQQDWVGCHQRLPPRSWYVISLLFLMLKKEINLEVQATRTLTGRASSPRVTRAFGWSATRATSSTPTLSSGRPARRATRTRTSASPSSTSKTWAATSGSTTRAATSSSLCASSGLAWTTPCASNCP